MKKFQTYKNIWTHTFEAYCLRKKHHPEKIHQISNPGMEKMIPQKSAQIKIKIVCPLCLSYPQ